MCCHTRVLKTHFCVLKLCCINWVSEKLSTEATYTSIYRVFGRFIAEKRQISTFELAKIDIILQRKCLELTTFLIFIKKPWVLVWDWYHQSILGLKKAEKSRFSVKRWQNVLKLCWNGVFQDFCAESVNKNQNAKKPCE